LEIRPRLQSKLEVRAAADAEEFAVCERPLERAGGKEDSREDEARQRPYHRRKSEREREKADPCYGQSGSDRLRQVEPVAAVTLSVDTREVHLIDARAASLMAV
jgi:hypothetical protein